MTVVEVRRVQGQRPPKNANKVTSEVLGAPFPLGPENQTQMPGDVQSDGEGEKPGESRAARTQNFSRTCLIRVSC